MMHFLTYTHAVYAFTQQLPLAPEMALTPAEGSDSATDDRRQDLSTPNVANIRHPSPMEFHGSHTGTAAAVIFDFQDRQLLSAATDERYFHDIKVEDFAADFSDCKMFFIDAGSNIGVHVRFLFEGEHYPKSTFQELFKQTFGDSTWRNKRSDETGLCAIGIEADPRHEDRLKRLEACYRTKGWKVKFLVPAAVTAKGHQFIKFSSRPDLEANIYSYGGQEVHVPTVDLSEVVEKVLDGRSVKGKVIVKMDIEGAEFEVIPRLDEQGCLCDGRISLIALEWHHRYQHIQKTYGHDRINQTLQKYTAAFASPACPQSSAKIQVKDDETYIQDQEYPLEQACR